MLESVCECPTESLSADGIVTGVPKIEGRPVWAEVRLGALHRNLHAIRAYLDAGNPAAGSGRKKPVKVLAVVKGNAYGHGAVAVAKSLAPAGVDAFCVTCSAEAIELRESGIQQMEEYLNVKAVWIKTA